MRRRSSPNPLAKANEPRWLVLRDRSSRPLRYTQLDPGADLKAALAAERARLIADGWRAEELTRYAFCFAERDDERLCISIEHYEPGQFPVGHGTHLMGKSSRKDS